MDNDPEALPEHETVVELKRLHEIIKKHKENMRQTLLKMLAEQNAKDEARLAACKQAADASNGEIENEDENIDVVATGSQESLQTSDHASDESKILEGSNVNDEASLVDGPKDETTELVDGADQAVSSQIVVEQRMVVSERQILGPNTDPEEGEMTDEDKLAIAQRIKEVELLIGSDDSDMFEEEMATEQAETEDASEQVQHADEQQLIENWRG